MDIQKIKDKSIVDYLAKRGIQPKRRSGRNWAYISPIGGESVPSLMVNIHKNRFRDYHANKHGDIITLVQEIENCDFKTAISKLSNEEYGELTVHETVKNPKPGIVITKVQEITDRELIKHFTNERKIDEGVLKRYCKQVSYKFPNGKKPDKEYTAIGFENSMGGWELRSSWQKVASPPKSYTKIKGEGTDVNLFEGFSDFLAALTYFRVDRFRHTTYILNGTGQINVLKPFLDGVKVNAFGDNDKAFDDVLNELDKSIINDCRYYFGFHNDFNKFLQNL